MLFNPRGTSKDVSTVKRSQNFLDAMGKAAGWSTDRKSPNRLAMFKTPGTSFRVGKGNVEKRK